MKRVAIIIGVAGGIGTATVYIFSDSGWHVVGVDRIKKLNLPGVVRFIEADISSPHTSQRIIDKVYVQEGRLDALINNAAIQICKSLVETTIDDWDL